MLINVIHKSMVAIVPRMHSIHRSQTIVTLATWGVTFDQGQTVSNRGPPIGQGLVMPYKVTHLAFAKSGNFSCFDH